MGLRGIERQKFIREFFKREEMVSVELLAKKLAVSEATIRRDLNRLEDAGVLTRIYGGATKQKISREYLYRSKVRKQYREKEKIATEAVKYIREDSIIFLDSGSTTFEIARLLKIQPIPSLLITNSFPILKELANTPSIRIYFLGGFFRRDLADFYSSALLDHIKNFSVDTAFLGVDGISSVSGLTTTDTETAALGEAIMEISSQVIVLADSTKVGRAALLPYGDLRKVDYLITDSSTQKKDLKQLQQSGIKTIFI